MLSTGRLSGELLPHRSYFFTPACHTGFLHEASLRLCSVKVFVTACLSSLGTAGFLVLISTLTPWASVFRGCNPATLTSTLCTTHADCSIKMCCCFWHAYVSMGLPFTYCWLYRWLKPFSAEACKIAWQIAFRWCPSIASNLHMVSACCVWWNTCVSSPCNMPGTECLNDSSNGSNNNN